MTEFPSFRVSEPNLSVGGHDSLRVLGLRIYEACSSFLAMPPQPKCPMLQETKPQRAQMQNEANLDLLRGQGRIGRRCCKERMIARQLLS